MSICVVLSLALSFQRLANPCIFIHLGRRVTISLWSLSCNGGSNSHYTAVWYSCTVVVCGSWFSCVCKNKKTKKLIKQILVPVFSKPHFCVVMTLPVAISIIGVSCRKYRFCRDKSFVVANTCLSQQKYTCCDKSMLVATNICHNVLSWQTYYNFVATKQAYFFMTKDVSCCNKHVFVVMIFFCSSQWYIWTSISFAGRVQITPFCQCHVSLAIRTFLSLNWHVHQFLGHWCLTLLLCIKQ